MREILFHGKRVDNGEWVEGIPINTHIGTFIVFEKNPHYCSQYGYMEIDELALIDPSTLGQYAGLTDLGNEPLFEHDVVTAKFKNNGARFNFVVIFRGGSFMFHNGAVAVSFDEIRSVRKIGNSYDNSELMKETRNAQSRCDRNSL